MDRRTFLKQTSAITGAVALTAFSGCATTPARRDESILIIGAGMAGIAAGQTLRSHGYTVKILEAQTGNGGRIRTQHAFGVPVDLGAAWIHGVRRNPVTDLAKRFNVSTSPTDWSTTAGYRYGGPMDPSDTAHYQDRLAAIYKKTYWKDATAHLDEMADEIVASAVRRSNVPRDSLRRPEDALTPAQRQEVDALRGAALEVDKEYKEFGGGDHLVTGGYDEIILGLEQGIEILHRQLVERIAFTGSGVSVSTRSDTFEAEKVLVTIPLGVLKTGAITFDPALPDDKLRALENLNMTTLNRIVLSYDYAFWPKEPHALARLDDPDSPQLFFNLHHYHDTPVLIYMLSANYAREVEAMDDPDAVAYATEMLRNMIGARAPEPKSGIRTRWNANPFSRGSFSYRGAGASPEDREALAAPMDQRLYFAGEATHATRYGTVHGAYLSGLRAADEILRNA